MRLIFSKKAFTLIELLVVVAVVGILAGLLFPVIGAVREQGRRVQCLNNLRQHGIAWNLYLVDHSDCFPKGGYPSEGGTSSHNFGGKGKDSYEDRDLTQSRVLNRYLEITDDNSPNLKLFQCPDDKNSYTDIWGFHKNTYDGYGTSYFANFDLFEAQPLALSRVTRPHDKIFLEIDYYWNKPGHGTKPYTPTTIPAVTLVLFVDGHIGGPFQYPIEFEDLGTKVFRYPY